MVRHAENQGVGGAIVTGFRLALDRGADIVVKMDGDGQMDPSFLPSLLDPIAVEGYAYAKGNRFLCEDRLPDMPKLRLLGSFGLTFLSKLASGYWHVFDPVNGYVAIDAAMLRRLPLHRLAKRYFFESDMLIHLNVFRARIKDVPVPPRYEDARSSMRSLSATCNAGDPESHALVRVRSYVSLRYSGVIVNRATAAGPGNTHERWHLACTSRTTIFGATLSKKM